MRWLGRLSFPSSTVSFYGDGRLESGMCRLLRRHHGRFSSRVSLSRLCDSSSFGLSFDLVFVVCEVASSRRFRQLPLPWRIHFDSSLCWCIKKLGFWICFSNHPLTWFVGKLQVFEAISQSSFCDIMNKKEDVSFSSSGCFCCFRISLGTVVLKVLWRFSVYRRRCSGDSILLASLLRPLWWLTFSLADCATRGFILISLLSLLIFYFSLAF